MSKLLQQVLLAITICITTTAHAWPTRPITLVIPFAPGGGADALARSMQQRVSEELGQAVNIEYKPGGAGLIAIRNVMGSDDDHRLLFSTTDVVVTAASIEPNFNVNDMPVISILARSTLVLATRPEGPYTDFRSVLQALESRPVVFGSPGVGSISHLVLERMLRPRVANPVIVQYKGGKPMATDTVGGHNDLSISSYGGTHQPFIDGGRLVAVVAFSDQRLAKLPQVPTAKELGVDIQAAVSWTAFGNSAMDAAKISRLNRAMVSALNDAATQKLMHDRGNEVLALSVVESQKFLDREIKTWREYVRKAQAQTSK